MGSGREGENKSRTDVFAHVAGGKDAVEQQIGFGVHEHGEHEARTVAQHQRVGENARLQVLGLARRRAHSHAHAAVRRRRHAKKNVDE